MAEAASACISGRTWLYRSSVMPTDACPSLRTQSSQGCRRAVAGSRTYVVSRERGYAGAVSRPEVESRGQAGKRTGHVVRVYWRALGRTDNQVVVLPLGRGEPLFILCLSVFLQRGERSRRQSDRSRFLAVLVRS